MKTVTNFEKVIAFHNAFGLPCDLPLNPNTYEDLVLRNTLFAEEVNEFWTEAATAAASMRAGQPVDPVVKANLLKEMVDVLYIVYGTAATFGLPIDTAFNRVHASNMSKLVDGKPMKRADGKVLKGPNYAAPNLTDLV